MPFNHILRKCTVGYKLTKPQEKINHLMYMNDIKPFSKKEKELKTLIHVVRIYSQDVGMEFDRKCAMLVMKSGKRHIKDGMELPNQDKIRTLGDKENLQILADIGSWHHQTTGYEKKKLRKNISEESESYLRQNLQNPIQRNKYLDCSPRNIFGTILEVKQMAQRTRKLMTMHKALHPRDNVNRLYVPRKGGGRGLFSIWDNVDASIQRLADNIQKRGGRLITATRHNTDNTTTNRTTINSKKKKKKMGRKTTLWMFLATNKQHLTRENMDVAKKDKP